MADEDFEALLLRFDPNFSPPSGENYITLTSHNNQADLINQRQLQKIIAAPFTYAAEIKDEFPEHLYPAEQSLILKVGAQVMFLKNDVLKCFFVSNPDSPYFQSETFNKVLLFLQKATNKAKLKQVGKNGILVVEDIKTMTSMFRFLEKAVAFQKLD